MLNIGLNAVDLCLSNCTWLEQYSEDLYPLDAGIDSGTTYMASRLPTVPLEKIHAITGTISPTSSFHDPMSSFFRLKVFFFFYYKFL